MDFECLQNDRGEKPENKKKKKTNRQKEKKRARGPGDRTERFVTRKRNEQAEKTTRKARLTEHGNGFST